MRVGGLRLAWYLLHCHYFLHPDAFRLPLKCVDNLALARLLLLARPALLFAFAVFLLIGPQRFLISAILLLPQRLSSATLGALLARLDQIYLVAIDDCSHAVYQVRRRWYTFHSKSDAVMIRGWESSDDK